MLPLPCSTSVAWPHSCPPVACRLPLRSLVRPVHPDAAPLMGVLRGLYGHVCPWPLVSKPGQSRRELTHAVSASHHRRARIARRRPEGSSPPRNQTPSVPGRWVSEELRGTPYCQPHYGAAGHCMTPPSWTRMHSPLATAFAGTRQHGLRLDGRLAAGDVVTCIVKAIECRTGTACGAHPSTGSRLATARLSSQQSCGPPSDHAWVPSSSRRHDARRSRGDGYTP